MLNYFRQSSTDNNDSKGNSTDNPVDNGDLTEEGLSRLEQEDQDRQLARKLQEVREMIYVVVGF